MNQRVKMLLVALAGVLVGMLVLGVAAALPTATRATEAPAPGAVGCPDGQCAPMLSPRADAACASGACGTAPATDDAAVCPEGACDAAAAGSACDGTCTDGTCDSTAACGACDGTCGNENTSL